MISDFRNTLFGLLYRTVPKELPCTVLVAGETWGNESIYIRQIKRLGIEKEVVLVDNYVPDGKVTDYFRASDLVVVPYLSATGSGVVKLAYS